MQENPPQGTKNEAKQYHTSRNEERSVKLINMLTILKLQNPHKRR